MTPSMPKATAVPIAWRISAPGPTAITSGMTPKMKAKLVIRIGRRRERAAWTAASIRVHALLLLGLARELDDQDRVLGGQRDQHDQPDLGEDVVVEPAQVDAGHRGEDAHRHDQDDGERQRQRFDIAPPAP